jgi:hypothetical protein
MSMTLGVDSGKWWVMDEPRRIYHPPFADWTGRGYPYMNETTARLLVDVLNARDYGRIE